MTWLKANAVVLLSALVVVWLGFALVRALLLARRQRPAAMAEDDATRAERVRAEVERTKADRKANPLPPLLPSAQRQSQPPQRRPGRLDPFGGPGRRFWAWIKTRFRRPNEPHIVLRG